MSDCTWRFETYTSASDTAVNTNNAFDVFLRSMDPFAISHAVNVLFVFFISIQMLGNTAYWLVFAVNKLGRAGVRLQNPFIISLVGWVKNALVILFVLLAVIKVLAWEFFEYILASASLTIKHYFPSLEHNTDIFSRAIWNVWFGDTYINSVMDGIDGFVAIGFGVYILWKVDMFFWKPRGRLSWWIRFVVLIVNLFVECVPTVFVRVNPCLPLLPSLGELFGGTGFNFIHIGLHPYTVIKCVVLFAFYIEDSKLFPKEKSKLYHAYMMVGFYIVWVCAWCAVPVFGVYVHLWLARITLVFVAWIMYFDWDRDDFLHINAIPETLDEDGENEEEVKRLLDGPPVDSNGDEL